MPWRFFPGTPINKYARACRYVCIDIDIIFMNAAGSALHCVQFVLYVLRSCHLPWRWPNILAALQSNKAE